MYIVIKFIQKARLKSYIDRNTELRKKAKNDLKKKVYPVNEKCSFWKNHLKCDKTEISNWYYLMQKPNDHKTYFFSKYLL